jgi:hypothetical protein
MSWIGGFGYPKHAIFWIAIIRQDIYKNALD